MSKVSSERKELLKNKAYLLYFFAMLISFFGNGMQFIASSWLALTLTGQNYSVAIVLIFSALPGIILSPFIGVLIDKWNKKYIACFFDVFRFLALITIPILYYYDSLVIWHIYAVTLLVAVGDTIFQPTITVMIREIVPKNLLLMANSTTQIVAQVGTVVGTGIGGIIVALYNPTAVMLINAITYFISAILIFLMPKIQKSIKVNRKKSGYKQDWKDGYAYLINNKNIWIMYLIMLSYPITLRTINSLLPIFTKNELQVGAKGFGYIDASFAIGAILGGYAVPYIVRKVSEWKSIVLGIGLLGLSIVLFSFSFDLISAILGYFLIGLTFQARIIYLTTIQKQVDIEYQGRVQSFYTLFVSIFALILYFVIGILSEVVQSRYLFIMLGGIIMIATIFAMNFIPKVSSTVDEKTV